MGVVLVSVSYVLMCVAMIHIIVLGYKQKTYAMPPVSTIVMMAVAALCGFIGPWYLPELFFPKENHLLTWLWRGWFFGALIAYIQWVQWREKEASDWPTLVAWLPVLSGIGFVIALSGAYTFIVFYQDFYVNEISPIGMLLVAIGYLGMLFNRPTLRGHSIAVGWYWFVSNAMLYAAVVIGGMENAYPGHEAGYAFIYWIYAVTLLLNAAYVLLLTLRRKVGIQTAQPLRDGTV